MMMQHNNDKSAEPQIGSVFACSGNCGSASYASGSSREQYLRPGERIDDLQRSGLHILQKPDAFRYGTDAVLLANFAILKPRDRVADLGTGTGILPLLMSESEPTAVFDAIELQPDMADMAWRSVAMNGLSDRIHVHQMDMRGAAARLGYGAYNLVVCNPPYSLSGRGLPSSDDRKDLARHLGDLSLEDVARSSAQLLKNGGRMALVYPASGLADLITALRSARMEPKRIRMVQGRPGMAPRLMLLDAVKNGGAQLDWLPPLILESADGSYTEELRHIYHMD